jgi:hypothetical protein
MRSITTLEPITATFTVILAGGAALARAASPLNLRSGIAGLGVPQFKNDNGSFLPIKRNNAWSIR